jgi:hypothetical protein
MSIKHAEIIIMRNIEEEPIYLSVTRYFGYEYLADNTDTIIIIFDDDTICDTKDEYIDKFYKFDRTEHEHMYPRHFNIYKGQSLFYKTPIYEKGLHILNPKPLFKDCKKFYYKLLEASKFNMIYQDINSNDVLSLFKIKSNEEKPRYLLAYDETIFDKSDIIYLVENIFRLKFI